VAADPDRPDLHHYNIVIVIPAYRAEREVAGVVTSIPSFVRHIVIVNDGSPDQTAPTVEKLSKDDRRIILLNHEKNRGVGAAMVTGFRKALELGAQIVVKLDADGQMAPEGIRELVEPLLLGQADLAKGNRFRGHLSLGQMPFIRRLGNTGLAFLAKAATGYWNCFDPTNGYFAIRGDLLQRLPLKRIDNSYFFEISLLSELCLLEAVVREIPMPARYGVETSSLSIANALVSFPPKLLRLLVRRILLKYFVHDFSVASMYLATGLPLLLFGVGFGGYNWFHYSQLGTLTPTGTVMLATLPVILGFQLVLSAIGLDIQSVPKDPVGRPLKPHSSE
jgi:glycosyltransferase involved in cell wall biosynthesis